MFSFQYPLNMKVSPYFIGITILILAGIASCVGCKTSKEENMTNNTEVIALGGGCFWCIEAVFEDLKGIEKVASGYSNGKVKNPTYKEVCSGLTGHAEVVQVTFDPKIISLKEILEVFFTVHDPTTLNRQGNDVGTQYRSGVYYNSAAQKEVAEAVIKDMTQQKVWDDPIVTEVVAADTFYTAEEYHQNYYNLNGSQPYCKIVIEPKVTKFRNYFKEKLKAK
jgi:peptide-methionine (S)-S-oxide reductase